jgi:hypothetical protein
MVQDELRSIQRQLKETRESAPRTQEIHLGMDMLGRQMQENRDLRLDNKMLALCRRKCAARLS